MTLRINLFLGALLLICFNLAVASEEDGSEDKWDVSKPPGSSKDIPIDTRSGTWMSLDVSPDGQTLVFDLLGDIYLLPMTGGEAKPINSGLAWSIQPRFSPDGSEIAFISDAGGGDNIWLMDTDGSNARQLTEEDFRLLNNPYWSPDGKYLAARKHFTTQRSLGTGEIWLYHRDGGSGVAVVEKPSEKHQKELGEPAFSPDGRYIYFSLDRTPGPTFEYAQDSNGTVFEIRRHDLHTGETKSLVSGAGGAVRPTPSPDGRYLAFVRRIRGESALFIKDLVSGSETPIYTGLDRDLQEIWAVQGVYPNMDWTPDSDSVVFWAGGKLNRIAIESKEVSEIEFHVADTRTVYQVSRPAVEVAPASFETRMARDAKVSPDGGAVVFETAGRLYIKKLPNGNAKPLTSDAKDHFEYAPSWSPDGKKIVFVTWNDQELGQIHSVKASGGRSKRLSKQPAHYHAPRFSPDGYSIVFEISGGGWLTSPDWSMQTGVFRIPAGGGDAELITDNGSNPHFGMRNDRLYVTRSRESGDGRALVSIDLNGEAPRVHAEGEYVSQFEVSPDDQHLAFRENYQVYVAAAAAGR